MPDGILTPEVLATKQKQRNAILTSAKKELAKAQAALSVSSKNITDIQVSLVKLRDYHKRVSDFSDEIQKSLTGDVQDTDIARMMDSDDVMLEMIARLQATADVMKDESRVVPSPSAVIGSHDTSSTSSTGETSRVRLPKIELRSYNGDPLRWDEFWDYYNVTFHSNNDIPVIEKFTYLRSILTDDALHMIEGYHLTAANYEEVIKALKDRFGDPEVAIFQHFDAMLTLSTASGDVGELQRVFDTCEAHIRSLIALGLSEETFGRVFAPIVLSKLPGHIRVELIRKKGRGSWSLPKLREFLRDEIYARDMSKRAFGATSSSKTEKKHSHGSNNHQRGPSNGKHSQNTVSALPNADQSVSGGRKPLSCSFCGGNHFNNKCTSYPTADARRGKIRGSCYCCLKSGHMSKDCGNKKPCFFCKKSSHHQSLCDKKFGSSGGENSSSQLSVGGQDAGVKSVTTSIMSNNGQRGVLQTAVADVSGLKSTISARQMLDNGSDNSFISSSLATKIGAKCIGTETISLAGFADAKRHQNTYKIYEFELHLCNGKRLLMKAYGTDVIICSIDKLAFNPKKYPVLMKLPLAEPLAKSNEHVNVDILVGSDYYYEIVKSERIPLDDGLMLLDSELGYVMAGRIQSQSKSLSSMLLSRNPMPQTNFDIERFWNLEEIGVKEVADTHEDEVALKNFNNTVQFDETQHRYMVKWPFKQDCPSLPDNFGLAFGRLKSLVARANTDNGLIDKCQAIFDDQMSKGIIEEAPEVPDGSMIHYLPHHAVMTPQKTTTKVRVVYDASSKTNRQLPSLNDCVYRGPVLLENLSGLLMRFRLHDVGVVSDIEKAFLQVGLQKEDRDVTRFLWLRDLKRPCTRDNLIVYRFARVCFGVNASPFLLGGTVLHHVDSVGTPVARDIRSNLYVDNVIDSKRSTEAALSYYTEAKKIFNDASMNLREWYSNDTVFMNSIADEDRGTTSVTKVLGLQWDLDADTLSCSVDGLKSSDVVTKRYVLQTIAKVYDPCGYFTPITSPAKWIMQDLWKSKYNWDTPLSDDLLENWNSVFSNLRDISRCPVPRRCFKESLGESPIDLHVFCDASAKSYCAVVYAVTTSEAMTPMSSLLFSKCRVSPVKHQSIPRLELLAATIGIRLLEFVSAELRLTVGQKYLWSDSQCVLHWITGKPVSTVFVRNRVAEIKKVQNVNFRYVPTADNPADIPTRGTDVESLIQSSLWWSGPDWLIRPDDWPQNPIPVMYPNDMTIAAIQTDSHATNRDSESKESPYLIDVTRVSTLGKLLRITGWVLRFIENLKCSVQNSRRMTLRSHKVRSDVCDTKDPQLILSTMELIKARLVWERAVQRHRFSNLFSSKKQLKQSPKSLGALKMNEEGVICCQGRLGNAELPVVTISPKLLPKRDPFSRLVIDDYHKRYHHAGINQTLAEIRCEYWIIKGRSEVRRVLNQCLPCRRAKGGSFKAPPIPDLPDFRVKRSPPFETTGIDYVGPLFIFPPDAAPQKIWICLFTCSVTRAIHLEVVGQMDSANFLLCFRRFMSFYGCPLRIVSDNAGQFHLAHRTLQKLWHDTCCHKDVQEFSAAKEIEWKFIPEKAPWMGGFYERLVGVVKISLKSAVNKRKLTLVELQTVVYEVVNVVNGRPLVYLEDEVGENPLTPAHLIMRHRTITPFASSDVESSTHDKLIIGWKRLQAIVNSFWSCWRKQYLLSLRENSRVGKQRNAVWKEPCVGEVVLIEDKMHARGQWRTARIEELIPSADGRIRSVKLRLANGRFMNRPIKLLYPLEIPKPVQL